MIIAIEGIDGSGKTVTTAAVKKELQKFFTVEVLDFPQYDSFFGQQIGSYLSGTSIMPDKMSMFLWFALDRFEALQKVKQCDILLCNRFTFSSMAFSNLDHWADIEYLENTVLKLPIPDLYYILDIDPQVAYQRNLQKKNRLYVEGLDLNEIDLRKQELAKDKYLLLSREPKYAGRVKIISANRPEADITYDIIKDISSVLSYELQ